MIDSEGFRYNVGIIVINEQGRLLWCRRYGTKNAWQFPQGGVDDGETPVQSMERELHEELGLELKDVNILTETTEWLAYRLPERFIRYDQKPLCVGQKQKWFLLQLVNDETAIRLDAADHQEFDAWRWVDYWYPVDQVIEFKRDVYQKTLQEFEPYVKKIRQ